MTDKITTPSTNRNQATLASAAKGGGIIFMGRLFAYAGLFVLGLITARLMGSTEYGIYALGSTMLTILTSASLLGLNAGVVQYIPFFKKRHDEDGLWGLIATILAVPTVVSLLLGILLWWQSAEVARWFDKPDLVPIVPLVAVALPFGGLLHASVHTIIGFKQMRYKVISQDIVLTITKLLLVIIFALFGLTSTLAMSAHFIGLVIASGTSLYFLHKIFPLNRSLKSAQFHPQQLFSYSLPVYVSELLMMVGSQFQILLLGMLSSAASVGILTVAIRLTMASRLFKNSAVTVSMPYISDYYSQDAWDELAVFFQTVTKWIFTINLPIFMVMVMFSEQIIGLFGSSFTEGEPIVMVGMALSPGAVVLIIFAFANLVDAGTGISGVIITMTERPILNTFNSALVIASTVLLNLWLIPILGMLGGAIAFLVATTIINTARLIQIFVLYRIQPYNVTFFKPIIAAGITTLVMITSYIFLLESFGVVGIGATVIVVFNLYFALIVALGLSAEDQFILGKVGQRFKLITAKLKF